MLDTKRAQNVCHACTLRKKTCDKALPACGFCARRRLLCRYDISVAKSRGRQIHDPVKHFIPIQSVEESLHQLAQHLIELTKLTWENIIDRYFEAFHKWFPVVSPDSFRREASRYQESRCSPRADFTIVLLAMLQIILPALDPPLRPPSAKRDLLYTSVKSAFSQAQASICTSLRLVQAALLIALHEYVCVRPDAAYVSVMTCAGLARVMGIGLVSVSTTRDVRTPSDSRLELTERENLAWTVAMLERLILCEIDQPNLQAQTEYPGPDCCLPSDLTSIVGLESKPGRNLQALDQITSSNLVAADADQFGRQAQLGFLLDRMLIIRRLAGSDKETKLTELTELDSKIRSFLSVVMDQLEWNQTRTCALVALCVRLLFLLHGSVLDSLQHSKSESDQQKREISWLALHMACKMTLDVVHLHGKAEASMLQICCFYNLRAARSRLQEWNEAVGDEALSPDIDSLLRTEDNYRRTWAF